MVVVSDMLLIVWIFKIQAAFNCIRSLWNRKPLKVYGERMAESMLAILCHILRGEPVIQERLSKEREGTSRADEEGGTGAGGASSAPGTGAVGESATGSGGGAGTGGGTTDDGSSSTARREPQVNQAQLTQVTGSFVHLFLCFILVVQLFV